MPDAVLIVIFYWVLVSSVTALWAYGRGYSGGVIFLVGLLLGPIGWGLTWLAVTVSGGPRLPRS